MPATSTPPALIIPTELAQAVVDYLSGRPYREVANLIAGMVRLEPAPADDEPSTPETST